MSTTALLPKYATVLPYENQAEFDEMLEELTAAWSPIGMREQILVREIVENRWKLQRARRVEAELLAARGIRSTLALAEWLASKDAVQLERVMRYAEHLEHAWYRSMAELRNHQAERRTECSAGEVRRRSEEILQHALMPVTRVELAAEKPEHAIDWMNFAADGGLDLGERSPAVHDLAELAASRQLTD